MKIEHLPQRDPPKCPECGTTHDCYVASSDPGTHPDPGDITVCLECLTPLQFYERPEHTAGLGLRRIPASETLDDEMRRLIADAARHALKLRFVRDLVRRGRATDGTN